jgi:hypothetical protein
MKSIKITFLAIAAIAPLIALSPQFTSKVNAQSISSRSCVADVVGKDIGSQVNIRSGPGIDFEIVGTVSVGNLVIIAEDDSNRSRHTSTLQRRDNQENRWYMVSRLRSSEYRGWMREDFLSLRCPNT